MTNVYVHIIAIVGVVVGGDGSLERRAKILNKRGSDSSNDRAKRLIYPVMLSNNLY